MHFEWDRETVNSNLRKHRVTFDEAAPVFYHPLAATFDNPDYSIGELRLLTIGYSAGGRLLVVSHVERGSSVRIISARLASARAQTS